MREKELLDCILSAARLLGWLAYHTYDSRRSEPGFPDCILIRNGVILVYETKTSTGRVTAAQYEWLDAFNLAGIPAKIVRPENLDDVLDELREAS